MSSDSHDLATVRSYVDSKNYQKSVSKKIPLSELYDEYTRWSLGKDIQPIGKYIFSKQLTVLGFNKTPAKITEFFIERGPSQSIITPQIQIPVITSISNVQNQGASINNIEPSNLTVSQPPRSMNTNDDSKEIMEMCGKIIERYNHEHEELKKLAEENEKYKVEIAELLRIIKANNLDVPHLIERNSTPVESK